MKNRLIITVSDVNGTKSYNIHQIVTKLFLIVGISAMILIGGSFWFINYQNKNIDSLKIKKEQEIKILIKKEQELLKKNKRYTIDIDNKIKDIKELSLKLDDIESIIGIKNTLEEDPITRATLAKITSLKKMYMLQIIPNGSPLKNTLVTARFGYRIHPVLKKRKFHRGIDLRAKRKTNVYATADGVVSYVQSKNIGTFGRVIVISHNYGFETVYGHLRKTKVRIGDIVNKGDLIALSGNSGRSTGPHLHYEVKYASIVLNPKYFINWNLKNYNNIFKRVRRVKWDSLVNLISKQKKKQGQQ